VIGYSQLLLEDARDEGDEAIARDLENINGAGSHLLKLVNDILDFSKIEAGKLDVHATSDNLAVRLAEIERTVRPSLAERKYELTCAYDGVDVSAEIDWDALAKAVKNILLGAASNPDGGRLALTASVSGGKCRLVIVDPHGATDGRAADTLFDIFCDDRDTTPTKYGGAGIALALGSRFIRLIGGDVTARQDGPHGRVFHMTFPAAAPHQPALALAS
jgi:signal transduction histidine kinase